MIEAGAVIDTDGRVVYWHLPPGRTGGSLPDDRTLWEVIWDMHKSGTLGGFAHSHPGSGQPGPSYTDVTTFAAIEQALGKRIDWWITTSDQCLILHWVGPGKNAYGGHVLEQDPIWAAELRLLSATPNER